MSTYGNKLFGLRDVKLTNIGGTVQSDLPAGRTLLMRLRLRTGELSGDDSLVAIASFIDAVEWSLEAGGIDIDAYEIMMGLTAVEAGTTPNRTNTLEIHAGAKMPYFKIYGKSLGDGDDDVHVKFWKAKLTSPLEGTFQDAQFFMTGAAGIAIDDGTNGILDIVQNETAANLPTS
jgi:hypothetical protein